MFLLVFDCQNSESVHLLLASKFFFLQVHVIVVQVINVLEIKTVYVSSASGTRPEVFMVSIAA